MKNKLKPKIKAQATQPDSWTWNPPLEQQLEAKMSALFDIAELADQIKDPECFRRHARKIAKAHGATTGTIKLNLGLVK